jgi:hypothetical protein
MLAIFEVKKEMPGEGCMVKKPSWGAMLIALVPFAAVCFSVSLWDRVYPMVLGLPFNLFWLISWVWLTPLIMWGAYRLEVRDASASRDKKGGAQ